MRTFLHKFSHLWPKRLRRNRSGKGYKCIASRLFSPRLSLCEARVTQSTGQWGKLKIYIWAHNCGCYIWQEPVQIRLEQSHALLDRCSREKNNDWFHEQTSTNDQRQREAVRRKIRFGTEQQNLRSSHRANKWSTGKHGPGLYESLAAPGSENKNDTVWSWNDTPVLLRGNVCFTPWRCVFEAA